MAPSPYTLKDLYGEYGKEAWAPEFSIELQQINDHFMWGLNTMAPDKYRPKGEKIWYPHFLDQSYAPE